MNRALVLSESDYAASRRIWITIAFFAGSVAGVVLTPALEYVFPRGPAFAVPEIVEQTPERTVARVPTVRDGIDLSCTVVIDHKRRTFTITC